MYEHFFRLRWLASEDDRFPGCGAILSVVALAACSSDWLMRFTLEAQYFEGAVFVGLDRRVYIRFDDDDSTELEYDLGVFESIEAERFDERVGSPYAET